MKDNEIIKTRSMLLEFMPKGVTKAYGISLLAKDLGLEPAEIMAIGDEENDLPMIEYAGLGVAMENAVPAVKESADYITSSNVENGVAKVIQKICFRLGGNLWDSLIRSNVRLLEKNNQKKSKYKKSTTKD